MVQNLRRQIQRRLDELQPLVEEARRLEAVLAALEQAEEHDPAAPLASPGTRLPKAKRKRQVLAVLAERGEARIKELAQALGVTHARAVQLANELEAEAMVERTAAGLRLTDRARQAPEFSIRVVGPVRREAG